MIPVPKKAKKDKIRLRLAEPSMDLEEAFLELAADYRAAGEQRYTDLHEVHGIAFDRYIKGLQRECLERDLSDGRVPCSTFWMLSDQGTICGISRLRHYLTPEMETEGGHILLEVPPSLRRRGHGSILLEMTLERAVELKIAKALLTCDWDNFGAIRVIKNNGGMLENTILSTRTGKKVMRFWIDLT
ncbi:MAG: GNAT family N-acetyltransferase [Candidatus Edwardsbacteria bacterium]|nr:GNAT family N-acetyltransferase [Candidatus Edwardsbacteria bacterium]